MRNSSLTALVCALLVLAALIAQGIVGSIAAVKSRQVDTGDEAVARAAVESFASTTTLHRTVGLLAIVPALALFAFAIVFSLNVKHYKPRNTRYPWLVTAGAAIAVALCVGMFVQGMSYADNLDAANWWLVEPPDGFPAGVQAVRGQVVPAGTFTTFVAIHGVILPFLTILTIIFIMPSFFEFAFDGGISFKKRSKWANITEGRT